MAQESDPRALGCVFPNLPMLALLEVHEFLNPPRMVPLEGHGSPGHPGQVQHTTLFLRYPRKPGAILFSCFGI